MDYDCGMVFRCLYRFLSLLLLFDLFVMLFGLVVWCWFGINLFYLFWFLLLYNVLFVTLALL